MTKCVTMQSAMAIIDNANNIDDTELMDNTPDVAVAKEFQYHRSCYKNITRSKQSDDSNREKNEAPEKCFRLLKEFVNEKIIQEGEVLRMITLRMDTRSQMGLK